MKLHPPLPLKLNKSFTLTHPSPLQPQVASQSVLKATSTKLHNRSTVGENKMEHCKNPWKNKCQSENIKLYIMFKGEKLPICKQCWTSIADEDAEW
jgi:hypothetical protein